MKKIPTIFERDWSGDRSRVVDVPHPECGWVFAGQGTATIKLDGTSVMVRDGTRYKRRELRKGEAPPANFEMIGADSETGKVVGWVAVGDGPDDQWHREARGGSTDGTYELVGPKIQGNPEHWEWHELVRHGCITPVIDPPRTFDGLREWFAGQDIEGIVFHHTDGRMGKVKLRDFGLKRPARAS